MKLTHTITAAPMLDYDVTRLGGAITIPAGSCIRPLGTEKDGRNRTTRFFEMRTEGLTWQAYVTTDRLRTRDN